MRLLLLVVFFWVSIAPPLSAADEDARRPGFFKRVLRTFGIGQTAGDKEEKRVKGLALTMTVTPDPVNLSETRQLKVALSLVNRSKRMVQLQFPTTQRIEVLVRDADGKLVTQWSEDQAFENQPVYVTVNPRERIEYQASVATRDMVAGRKYTVEGFFPNFDRLRATKQIVPTK